MMSKSAAKIRLTMQKTKFSLTFSQSKSIYGRKETVRVWQNGGKNN